MAGRLGKYFTTENERGAKSAKQISALIYVPGVGNTAVGCTSGNLDTSYFIIYVLTVRHNLWRSR